MSRLRPALAGGLLLGAACASPSASPPPRAAPRGGPGLDPQLALPAARAELGTTGGREGGLRLADGEDEAREVVARLLRAVLDADRPTLETLVDDPVGRTLPRLGPLDRERGPVLDSVVRSPLRTGHESSADLDALVHESRITVSTLPAYLGTEALPMGFHARDRVVRLPLTPLGSQLFHALLPGWLGEGVVVVRPGSPRPIVAL